MIIWLASYPRSGNTFFRVILNRVFGLRTHSVYSVAGDAEQMPDDTAKLMRLIGQTEMECDIDALRADSAKHFVKTHDLPRDDDFPAVVLIRDGRDAVVSYAHFLLKASGAGVGTDTDVFDTTLEKVITGDDFGGWSAHVNAWIDRMGPDCVVRFEDLIEDPVNAVAAAVQRFGFDAEMKSAAPPSFQELQGAVPWFFRRGKSGSWTQEMPPRLQNLFLERHGDALARLGYR